MAHRIADALPHDLNGRLRGRDIAGQLRACVTIDVEGDLREAGPYGDDAGHCLLGIDGRWLELLGGEPVDSLDRGHDLTEHLVHRLTIGLMRPRLEAQCRGGELRLDAPVELACQHVRCCP